MQGKKLIEEVSIPEQGEAPINGHLVAASGIYEDEDGEPMVDLRVDKRLFDEQLAGDYITIGADEYEIVGIVRGKAKGQKGTVVLRRD